MACLFNMFHSLFGPRYYHITKIEEMADPGDLIAFNRGLYQHYALYIGNGKVINVGAEDMVSNSALISEMTLEQVARDSYARIENHNVFASECYGKRAKHPQNIVRRARRHVGRYLPYEFLFRNCEYYCTFWRFGVGFSKQVIDRKSSDSEKYGQFAEHEAVCRLTNSYFVCRCPGETLSREILELLLPNFNNITITAAVVNSF